MKRGTSLCGLWLINAAAGEVGEVSLQRAGLDSPRHTLHSTPWHLHTRYSESDTHLNKMVRVLTLSYDNMQQSLKSWNSAAQEYLYQVLTTPLDRQNQWSRDFETLFKDEIHRLEVASAPRMPNLKALDLLSMKWFSHKRFSDVRVFAVHFADLKLKIWDLRNAFF